MAVYTEISDAEITALLQSYTIGNLLALEGIAEGVENSNFFLRTTEGTYILTIYEKRVNPKDLPFFLELMHHLSRHNIPCPTPVADKQGNVLQTLKGRSAAIVSFLQGKSIKQIRNHHLEDLGKQLARMHLAGTQFPMQRTNNFSLEFWQTTFEAVESRADEVTPGLAKEIRQQLAWLQSNWPKHLPSGVIHADLFPDNVFFEHDRISGLIDFYFACNDFLAYDLAICMNSWCFEGHGELNVTKARTLVAAYNSVRPLTAIELHAMPILASGAAMRFLISRLYDWLNRVEGALVTPKNPLEYLKKLRFHQGISKHDAYGIYTETA